MRYERAVQALTDLFEYYGKGELAEGGARCAGAHRASGERAALHVAARREERDAEDDRHRRAGAARRSRRAGRHRGGAQGPSTNERVLLWPARSRRRCSRTGRSIGSPDALTAAEAARAGAGSTWSSWRPAAPTALGAARCRIPTRGCARTSSTCSGSRRSRRRCRSSSRWSRTEDEQVARRRGAGGRCACAAPTRAVTAETRHALPRASTIGRRSTSRAI